MRWMASVMFMLMIATGATAQQAAIGDLTTSSDAEDFHSTRIRAGALVDYRSPFQYIGVAAQDTHYTQAGWNRDAPAVLFLWRRQKRATLAGTIAEAGLVKTAGRTRVIGDAAWSFRPEPHTGFEIVAAADLVETQRALDRATSYTFAGAGFDRQLSSRVTAIGLAGYQHFTDGNERLHARVRLVWSIVPEQGINAQIRFRHFKSRQLDVDRAYFNPSRYSEWNAGLYVRKRYAGWIWMGTLAGGRESMPDEPNRTTSNFELRAEGPLPRDIRLVVHASYNRSAGFAISDRYWYTSAGAMLVIPLRRNTI